MARPHVSRAACLILPGWFREEFAAEMTADFRESLPDARRNGVMAATRRCGLSRCVTWSRSALRLRGDALAQDCATRCAIAARDAAHSRSRPIGTLALGMGPTLVVANLVERVVLRPLPFDQPDRLVSVWNAQPERGRREFPLSVPDYVDFRDRQQAFAALAAHTGTSVAFVGTGEPRQIAGVLTTAELLRGAGRPAGARTRRSLAPTARPAHRR